MMQPPPAPKNSSKNWFFSFSVACLAVCGFAWWAGLLPDFSSSSDTASHPSGKNGLEADVTSAEPAEFSDDKNPPLDGVTQWEPDVEAQLVSHSRIVAPHSREQNAANSSRTPRPLTADDEERISQLFADDQPYFADENSGLVERSVTASELGAIPSSTDVRGLDPAQQFGNIDAMIATGKILEAHRELSLRYWNHPEQRAEVLPRVQKTAQTIYLSPQPHFMQAYEVQPGDMLQQIA
ncbi:MAG TPA: hypothetical protein VMM56_12740, partial [Planctomycetaceae bacterium]|nr:hypothetical protein [Planctomycetaceae bacterium]